MVQFGNESVVHLEFGEYDVYYLVFYLIFSLITIRDIQARGGVYVLIKVKTKLPLLIFRRYLKDGKSIVDYLLQKTVFWF